jgi:hypothetical protein
MGSWIVGGRAEVLVLVCSFVGGGRVQDNRRVLVARRLALRVCVAAYAVVIAVTDRATPVAAFPASVLPTASAPVLRPTGATDPLQTTLPIMQRRALHSIPPWTLLG